MNKTIIIALYASIIPLYPMEIIQTRRTSTTTNHTLPSIPYDINQTASLTTKEYLKYMVYYAQCDNIPMVQHLIKHGNQKHKNQRRRLFDLFCPELAATQYTNYESVYIKTIINLYKKLPNASLIEIVTTGKNLTILKDVLDAGANIHEEGLYNNSVLTYLIQYSDLYHQDSLQSTNQFRKIVTRLIQEKIDLNHPSTSECTPLHFLAGSKLGHFIEQFVEAGAVVDSYNKWGYTPLVYAIKNSQIDNTKKFLLLGADPNTRDKKARTALHKAATIDEHTAQQIIPLLLFYGAHPESTDLSGRTAHHNAAQNSPIYTMLSDRAAVRNTIMKSELFKKKFIGNIYTVLKRREHTGSHKKTGKELGISR